MGGGGVKDLANDLATAQKQAQQGGGSIGAGGQGYNAPDASNAQGYFRAAGQADADTPSFPAQAAMTFEMKPEMLSYDITDRVIQIYDMVLDYSGKHTAAEIMEQFENSAVEFEFEKGYGSSPDLYTYVPDEWIGPGPKALANSTKSLHLQPKHEEKFYIEVVCINPTDEIIELKDTVVYRIVLHRYRNPSDSTEAYPYPVYIWFPRGIRIDCNGLNYENLPERFPEFEVIKESDSYKADDGLYWDASMMTYVLKKHVDDVYRWDGTTSPLYACYRFTIDSITKEISVFTYDVGVDYIGSPEYVEFGYNIKEQTD